MDSTPNFLEEEDYDEPASKTQESTTANAPVFGESGFGKGKPNPRKGSPRARVTDLDIPVIYFLGHFVGADVEACSLLNTAKPTKFGNLEKGGGLTSISTTQNRLDKLRRLGVVERYRHPMSGTFSYGLTSAGFAAAREYGLNMDAGRSLSGIATSRLYHYRAIALVAAQFVSPAGYFRSIGIAPVPLEKLVSENAMRAAYEPVRAELAAIKKKSGSGDFGTWRKNKLAAVLEAVKDNRVSYLELIEAYPVLLTLGQPERAGAKTKPVHQPDLAVNLDANRNGWAKNILVEVELSKKDRDEYTRILHTFAEELKKPDIYLRVFYFAVSPQVETILREIDAHENLGLFENNRLSVFRITDRNGVAVAQKKRITIGGN